MLRVHSDYFDEVLGSLDVSIGTNAYLDLVSFEILVFNMGGIVSKKNVFSDCCCDYKTVIVASKRAETILEEDFGGTGRGLHEKANSSVGLDAKTLRQLHKIATIRNCVVHEEDHNKIGDLRLFKKECMDVFEILQQVIIFFYKLAN